MEQHPLISLFAPGILGGIITHFVGDDPSPWYVIPFLLILLPLLLGSLFLLGLIFKIAWDSWTLFRFLRRTQNTYFACTHCGYDLRHKPERCPECGQRVWFRNRRKTAPPIPPPSDPGVIALPSHGLPSPPDIANNDSARPADR